MYQNALSYRRPQRLSHYQLADVSQFDFPLTVHSLLNQDTSVQKKSFSLTKRNNSYEMMKKWEDQVFPIKPEQALMFQQYLTEFEKKEILNFQNIYYLGHKIKIKKVSNRYDDDKGDYCYQIHDHINYRYEIIEPLGKGSFGCVLKVLDHKQKEHVALKIIKSQKKFFNQAFIEFKILKFLKDNDPDHNNNILLLKDFFIFRNHVCIVTELLQMNLYDFLKINQFEGMSLEFIRRISVQLLTVLNYLKTQQIIHCDLKPENILLKQINKSGIKLIDFGSSCFASEKLYTYIQSRFYRAPEIILGLPYGCAIDMWSFGCLVCELYLGVPIFPGENEHEQMQLFMEVLDVPPKAILEQAQRRKVFFNGQQTILLPNSQHRIRFPGTKNWNQLIKTNDLTFIDFIQQCFTWDPNQRMTPDQALSHDFIVSNLPMRVKIPHLERLQASNTKSKTEVPNANFSVRIQAKQQKQYVIKKEFVFNDTKVLQRKINHSFHS